MTVLTSELRKSRRQRGCPECGRKIQVGETYRYQFASGDGAFDAGSWQCCEQCDVLLSALWNLPDVYRDFSDEGFEIRSGGRDIIQETSSIPLRRAYAWQTRKWVRADGTPIPVADVREMLGTHKEQAA